MKSNCATLLRASAALLICLGSPMAVAKGPGIGNLTYPDAQVGKSASLFNNRTNMPGPGGVDTVLMTGGYLVVLGTMDSGKPPGVFHIYDVKDPTKPVKMKSYSSPLTANLAEWHMAGFARVNGKTILVNRTTTGIALFDFTDPLNPADMTAVTLTGVNGGDYTNADWMNSVSWPYIFAGSSGSGVNVVDFTDPTTPKQITTIPIGKTGNFRVGGVYAAGNYLIITNMDQNPFRASVLDVSDVMNPALLTTGTAPHGVYSAFVIGDWIYGSGEGAHFTFMKWSPTAITLVAENVFGYDKGAYNVYQDGVAFMGQSAEGFKKVPLQDPTNLKVTMAAVLTQAEAPGGDFDFVTVMGNLVFQGNDHGSGSGFLVHQAAPDTTPPEVLKVYPEPQSTKQALSTRVTVFFTDEIDLDSVSPTSFVVRKMGGVPLTGNFSHSSSNAVSFGAEAPLEANTIYEVVIPVGGVTDLVGNKIAKGEIARFSTGSTMPPPPGPGDIGVIGTGGTGGGAGVGGTGGTVGTGGGAGGSSAGGTLGTGAAGAGAGTGAGGSATGGTVGTVGGAGVGAVGQGGAGGSHGIVSSSSGCGCNVPGGSSPGLALSLLAAVATLGSWRRRTIRRPGRRSDVR